MPAVESDQNSSGGDFGSTKQEAINTSAPMAGPEEIYQTERWGECLYTLPMKPLDAGHAYTVRLHFAETTFDAAGKRIFNVEINGRPALTDFDVFRDAGGKDKALVKEFPGVTPDGNGNILIRMRNGSADKPEINGIEVINPSASSH